MKRVGIFINLKKSSIQELLLEFIRQIKNSKYKYMISDSAQSILKQVPDYLEVGSREEILGQSDLIAAFGGDGTILWAVQKVGKREIPILGVNIGGLGFLAATSIANARKNIEDFLNGKLKIERRSLLKLKIDGVEEAKYALNDFVIDKGSFSRMIKISAYLDNKLLNSYLADGLIISTPTGSTAYSLSNGGPIMLPLTNAFIINPICPHTLSNRPVVIPDSSAITIKVESELNQYTLIGDGQDIGNFTIKTKLNLAKAEFSACLIHIPQQDFYTTLSEKLGWGEDLRHKFLSE
jgi:NAD+ kinase